MNTRPISILVVLASFAAVAGCKSSSTSPSTGFTIAGAPAPGSSWTYHVIQYDPSGAKSGEFDNTSKVTGHEQSWNGRQNVVVFDSNRGTVYESNGDLTVFVAD